MYFQGAFAFNRLKEKKISSIILPIALLQLESRFGFEKERKKESKERLESWYSDLKTTGISLDSLFDTY